MRGETDGLPKVGTRGTSPESDRSAFRGSEISGRLPSADKKGSEKVQGRKKILFKEFECLVFFDQLLTS